MLSALIQIKTKVKTDPSVDEGVIPVIRNVSKSKKVSTPEGKKSDNTKKNKKSTSNEKKHVNPRGKKKSPEAYTGEEEYSTFEPIKEEKEVPKPWEETDEDLVGGVVKFKKESRQEGENDKYIRQDSEWKEVVKAQKVNYDSDSETEITDSMSEIQTPSENYMDGVDENDFDFDNDDQGGDMVEFGEEYLEKEVCGNDDDVFYQRITREKKEKLPTTYTGVDIGFDDEYIP